MSKNLIITLSLLVVAALGIGLLVYLDRNDEAASAQDSPRPVAPGASPEEQPTAPADVLVRENSRYLDQVDDARVTVVEFLDFECEACRAHFPVMEQIREDYDGRINTVIRYFPLPGHLNSVPSASAVEAAARQDALDEMYQLMFETQGGWGESQEDQSEVFVGFAEDLGLDVDEFVETMEAAETQERVQADFDDGLTLGVQGTPTIYVNGLLAPSMPSHEVLSAMIDSELE